MMTIANLNFPTLISKLQIGVVVHNALSQVVYANPKALEILRLSHEQILGKDALDEEWQFLDCHLKPMPPECFPVKLVLANKKNITNIEVGITDPTSKQIHWALCNAFAEFDDNGNIEYVIVDFIDITQQKQEIPFKEIVERANDAIIVTDAQSPHKHSPDIVYVNQAFSNMTEYSKTEAVGRTTKLLQGTNTCNMSLLSD